MDEKLDLSLFTQLVEAAEDHDGHLTIMKFTTNWRVSFSTPGDREDISAMAEGKTFADAAGKLLAGESPGQ